MSNFGLNNIPPAVRNIIAINIAMAVMQHILVLFNFDLAVPFGLHYWETPSFKVWQPLTHIFMHGSATDPSLTLRHLFFNMFGLYMFGPILEDIWGSRRFILFFLICGLGAAFCQLAVLTVEYHTLTGSFIPVLPASYLPYLEASNMVGASGAVMGVLMGFAYIYPNVELYIMFIPIPVKAKFAIAGYVVLELFSGFGNFKGDNVAHFAHLGGMLFAFILLKIWGKPPHNRYY